VVGGLLFILGIAGIVQETTPNATTLAPGLLVLVTVSFFIGLVFLAYGAVWQLRHRGK
jgi:high-affinity Fe2+/Pb2+ permease